MPEKEILETWATINVCNMVDSFHLTTDQYLAGPSNQMQVRMIATTAYPFLAINEWVCAALQLPFNRKARTTLPDGKEIFCDLVDGVELRFANRYTLTSAYVLPDNTTPLLGAIILETLNLLIDPLQNKLILPPDRMQSAVHKLVSIRPLRSKGQ